MLYLNTKEVKLAMREIVGSMSEWSGVLKDLFRQIDDGSITLRHVQAFLQHRNPFEVNPITDWQNFYKDTFGLECNFADLRLPTKQEGFDRLIIVAQGMPPQGIFGKCNELFPFWKWTGKNLDEIVSSVRTSANEAYAVWFRNSVEPDEELENLSANDLEERGIHGITLEERLLYGLKYFMETEKHLDRENITLCSGSRYSDGSVPSVNWSHGKLYVDCYDPNHRYAYLRSRRAVL